VEKEIKLATHCLAMTRRVKQFNSIKYEKYKPSDSDKGGMIKR
jgi:hypothetical protein